MSKILLTTNRERYNQLKANKIHQCKEIFRAKELFKEIVGSNDVEFSLSALESFILSETGFRNIQASADLLGIKYQYNELIEFFNKNINLEEFYFDEELNRYSPKAEILDAIEEECSIYVKNEYVEDYKASEKAIKYLNQIDISFIGSIKQNATGKWILHKTQFATSMQFADRKRK